MVQLTPVASAWKFLGRDVGFIYLGKESVAIPIPGIEKLNLFASGLGPWIAIGKWGVESKSDHAERQEDDGTKLTNKWAFAEANARNPGGNIVVELAKCDDGKVESWEVMMQEQLALHQKEWEVMECPS